MDVEYLERVKFYSEQDMAYGIELSKIVDKINANSFDCECKISDIIEFNNILKYIDIKRFSDYIEDLTLQKGKDVYGKL